MVNYSNKKTTKFMSILLGGGLERERGERERKDVRATERITGVGRAPEGKRNRSTTWRGSR